MKKLLTIVLLLLQADLLACDGAKLFINEDSLRTTSLSGKVILPNINPKDYVVKAFAKTDIWYAYPFQGNLYTQLNEGVTYAAIDQNGAFSFLSSPGRYPEPDSIALFLVSREQHSPGQIRHLKQSFGCLLGTY